VSLGEFDLIARYFDAPAPGAVLGIGDDCALWSPSPGQHLALSCDTLVEGRHFLPDVDPIALGHKALAVNLSDLAACGARPCCFLLAATLPRVDEPFLAGFSQGLRALAAAHRIDLVGGNTTAGPLAFTLTVMGEVPPGQALLRSAAQPGDDLWVSGTLGEARLALMALQGQVKLGTAQLRQARVALEQPQPQVALGLALRGVARAAIDLSDGLLADLGHILQRSGPTGRPLGARIACDALPLGTVLQSQPVAMQQACALAGGDDYQLCFTAAASAATQVAAAGERCGVRLTKIGCLLEPGAGVQVNDGHGRVLATPQQGFDHFRVAPA
jgi:thiamine-monophosphate kinase